MLISFQIGQMLSKSVPLGNKPIDSLSFWL